MKKTITILALMITGLSYSQSINDSLLLRYPFSGNANDISGNGFNGIVNASQTTDRFGNPNEAYSFNGINEYIDFPNASDLKPELPVSFSFWIKYNSVNAEDRVVFNSSLEEDVNSGIFFNSQASTGNYAVGFGDGSPSYSSSTRRSYVSNTAIDTSNWHHIAVIINSATDMKIYIDCLESGGTYSGSGGALNYSNTPGSIARNDQNTGGIPSFYFKGHLDDFRYWDRELTLRDIDSLCDDLVSSTEETNIIHNGISAYPNPVKDILRIEVENYSEIENIVLFNAVGQIIDQNKFQPEMMVGRLNSGIYFLHFLDKDKKLIDVIKVVKE